MATGIKPEISEAARPGGFSLWTQVISGLSFKKGGRPWDCLTSRSKEGSVSVQKFRREEQVHSESCLRSWTIQRKGISGINMKPRPRGLWSYIIRYRTIWMRSIDLRSDSIGISRNWSEKGVEKWIIWRWGQLWSLPLGSSCYLCGKSHRKS